MGRGNYSAGDAGGMGTPPALFLFSARRLRHAERGCRGTQSHGRGRGGVLCLLSFFGPPPVAAGEEVLGACVSKPGCGVSFALFLFSARRLRRVKRRCWGTASPSRGNGDIPCPLPFFRPAACGTRRGGAGGRSPMAGGAGGSPVFFSPLRGPPQAGRGSTR